MKKSRQAPNPAISPLQLRRFILKAAFGLTDRRVAYLFGVTTQHIKRQNQRMREVLGARNNAHAAYLLWPVIEKRWLLDSAPDGGKIGGESR